MRIKKIFINGFGTYHHKTLDLNQSITVFKGSNETGKTTIMQFVRTVFFGFKKPSKSQPKSEWFVPVVSERHGGYIEIENDSELNYRIERYLDGTRDYVMVSDIQTGEIITEGEHFLEQLLGGIDREEFEQKYAFGINDLGNHDDFDFNQKMYDVGLGIKGLTPFLEQIAKQKKKLISLGEGSFGTNSAELYKKEERIQEIITKADDYLRHQTEQEDLEKNKDDTTEKLEKVRLKKQLLQAIQYWNVLKTSQIDLKNFEKYQYLPKNAENRFSDFQEDQKREGENLKREQKSFNESKDLSSELIHMEEILQDEGDVESLRDDLKSFSENVEQLKDLKEDKNLIEHQLETQIKELNHRWTENDLVLFDSSETMIEEINKIIESSEALDSRDQGNTKLSKYYYWILAGLFGVASLGLFFESMIERVTLFLIGGISILLFNIWSSKKSQNDQNVFAKPDFKFQWDEFKKKNSFPVPVSLDTALNFLDRARGLKADQENLEKERKNIATVEENILKFSGRTSRLAKKYILSNTNTVIKQVDIDGLAEKVYKKLAEVKRGHQDREKDKYHMQKTAKEIEKINDTLKNLQDDFQDLLNQVDCNSEADFEIYLENHKKFKASEIESEKAEKDIRNIVGSTQSIEDFKSHLKEFSESEPESELEIDEEISILEKGLQEIGGDLVLKRKEIRDIRSENELQELLLEKESLIEGLNKHIEDWFKLKIAEEVLTEVQKKLQTDKQPSVIKLAEKYFKKITSGQYINITVDVDREDVNDSVNVLQNDQVRKNPSILSGGTKDQLFLSMRLGEIVNNSKSLKVESLPMLFDDILANSDFDRSNKIIETMGQISKQNQIIYFTFNPVVVEGFSKLGSQCEIIEL